MKKLFIIILYWKYQNDEKYRDYRIGLLEKSDPRGSSGDTIGLIFKSKKEAEKRAKQISEYYKNPNICRPLIVDISNLETIKKI